MAPSGRFVLFSYDLELEKINASMIVENRESTKPEKQKHSRVIYPSLKILSGILNLYAGKRFLPGPRSFYLADPEYFSGLSGIPHGRSIQTFFLNFYPEYYLPGIFLREGSKKPGLFLQDQKERFLLSWHPETRTGNITVKLNRDALPFFLYADIQKISITPEGFLSLYRSEETDNFQYFLEAERIESWDANGLSPDDHSRKGKSGLLFVSTEYSLLDFARLSLSGGGQDIGNRGYRIAEFKISQAMPFRFGSPVLRLRSYRRQIYGDQENDKDRRIDSFAGGWTLGKKTGFSIIGESRNSGIKSGELQIHVSFDHLVFSISGIFATGTEESSEDFLFIRKNDLRGYGSVFYEGRGLLFITLKNKYIYFRVYSYEREKKKYITSSIQFNIKF